MAGRGKKRAAPKKEPAADAEDGATVSLETGGASGPTHSEASGRSKRGGKRVASGSPRRGRSASLPSATGLTATGLPATPQDTPASPAPMQSDQPPSADAAVAPRRRGRPPGRGRGRGRGRSLLRAPSNLGRESSVPSADPSSQPISPEVTPLSADEGSSPDKKRAKRTKHIPTAPPRQTRNAAALISQRSRSSTLAPKSEVSDGSDTEAGSDDMDAAPSKSGGGDAERDPAGASASPEDPSDGLHGAPESDDDAASGPGQVDETDEDEMEERQEREDAILQRAADIRRTKAAASRTGWQEPKRPKGHWEHLLEEMQWMAKEFAKERRWKLGQAKRLGRAVTRSNLDVDSRSKRKEKEEQAKLQRHAGWIAKEVTGFWRKAERVVYYKHQAVLDARKREAYDKQLDFLVDQTQRYSTLLAQRLTIGEGPRPLAPAQPLLHSSREDTSIRTQGAPGGPTAAADAMLLDEDSDGLDGQAASEEDDDEATLEEEEAQAEREGGRNHAVELADLQQEAELPLEELLAQYGYVVPDDAPPPAARQRSMPSEAAKPPSEASSDSDMQPASVGEAEDPMESGSDDASEMEGAGTDEEDNEDTLDEEEKMAEREGGTSKGHYEQELQDLDAEADMPIDELLARYRAQASPSDIAVADGLPQSDDHAGQASATTSRPTGDTLATANVHAEVPFLLKHTLREYQHIGLNWMLTLNERRLNGILADEMGLGKTIMTIALLAHMACEKGDWGPHLVVVPTSVMLNWEMEFKKWCPAFKLLTYYGSARERRLKRQGWSKPNAFHVCITSYTLILQDAKMFRRKKWKFLILDEAHMIKNWKSQRWQTLLNFNSRRRLLITGTPLQNDLMELWSLMHFLMPQVFASHAHFKDWFSNPLSGMVEGQEAVNKSLVERLHSVLRPFLLRRLKADVEKQLPGKHEHVLRCRLSKRQRNLYEEYMASSDTRARLSGGSYLGIINVLMQLRKVCDHPDLFEPRPIVSSFDLPGISKHWPSLALDALPGTRPTPHLPGLPQWTHLQFPGSTTLIGHLGAKEWLASREAMDAVGEASEENDWSARDLLHSLDRRPAKSALAVVAEFQRRLTNQRVRWARARQASAALLSQQRSRLAPCFSRELLAAVTVTCLPHQIHEVATEPGRFWEYAGAVLDAVKTPLERVEQMDETIRAFMCVIPQARAPPPICWCSHPSSAAVTAAAHRSSLGTQQWAALGAPLRMPLVRQQLFFPDRRLLQYDCGKLQELAGLLYRLKTGGHKALIFTQMSRMLDILEAFLNLHSYSYLRLDGSTKPEQRQILMQRFNTNSKIFVFILSTRSGGVGMNLTGADTVIFYDSDWNPAMDAQAQDRCHRIGQTREVHIYRLISEKTIEENILLKSDQKRHLDFLAIQSGGFNPDALRRFSPQDLFSISGKAETQGPSADDIKAAMRDAEDEGDAAAAAALEQEAAADLAEFNADPVPAAAAENDGDDEDAEPEDGRDEAVPASGDGSAAAQAGAQPPAAEPALAERQPSAAMDAGGGVDEAELGVTQLMEGAGRDSNALAQLEASLRPIERYAVRVVEETHPGLAPSAVEDVPEPAMPQEQWSLQELERIEAEQEAEAEEEGGAAAIADWDKAAAGCGVSEEVERALEQQRLWEADQAIRPLPCYRV
ncbi:hypothetical protein WJX84_005155 [Apatococcus fuscideae]|uniref:Uncharacterized protein n=1 Tax=Apatococcus fuscideae TaxID=2026836 RepID=A0AAW1TGC2_9CHLO